MTKNPNCDGNGPHWPTVVPCDIGEVRRYELGDGAALHLCYLCWGRENRYRWERATIDDNGMFRNQPRHDLWPQQDWEQAKVYVG